MKPPVLMIPQLSVDTVLANKLLVRPFFNDINMVSTIKRSVLQWSIDQVCNRNHGLTFHQLNQALESQLQPLNRVLMLLHPAPTAVHSSSTPRKIATR